MLEETKLPEELVVGETYTVNVVKQYLMKNKASYIGDSIFSYKQSDKVKVVDVLKGKLHTYEDGFTHLSKNYNEVYKLNKL